MKLVSFANNGNEGFGLLVGAGIVDLRGRLDPGHSALQDVLGRETLARLRALEGEAADFALEEVQLLPPIVRPPRIFCIGLNYGTHLDEAKRLRGPSVTDPQHPIVFFRNPAAHVGHGQPILRPAVSEMFDWEGEVAVVIGDGGRRISRADALAHVAGYSCYNDGSVRDFQRHSSQWGPGKNFDRSGSFGPWITTADEIPDPSKMVLITRVNGEVMQHASVGDLIFDIPALIEYCSTFTALQPGDVIVSGTTGGVGGARTPPVWLKAGDTLEVEVQPVGILRNPVEPETL